MSETNRQSRPTVEGVAARFLAASAVGSGLSFLAFVTGGPMLLLAVPLVLFGTVVWAAGAFTTRLSSRIGFGVAPAVGPVGAIVPLTASQGMSGHPSFATVLLIVALVVVPYALVVAAGLAPLAAELGSRAWRYGMGGFAAWALVACGMFALVEFLVESPLRTILFLMLFWLPPFGGGLAVASSLEDSQATDE